MSSNIRIEKTCEYCSKAYEAKTVYTRYCSHSCNRKAYKQAKRNEKISIALKKERGQAKGKLPITTVSSIDYNTIQTKELLTINEACALLNITHVTLRRWLKEKVIVSARIGKKHIIKRAHLYALIK